MPKMIIQQEGVEIAKRFFIAIDELRKKKQIRGLQSFTRKYGLNYWNTMTVKNDPQGHILKTEWLSFLVRDYNVSAEWLLLGSGDMFNENPLRSSQTTADKGY